MERLILPLTLSELASWVWYCCIVRWDALAITLKYNDHLEYVLFNISLV
jgi:hypothetical protein